MEFWQKFCCRLTILLILIFSNLHSDEATRKFSMRADLLYLTPRVTGLELNFGSTRINQSLNNSTPIISINETDLDPHFKWNTGYRFGLAYERSDWEIEALYTHFCSSGSRSIEEEQNLINQGKVKIALDQIDLNFALHYDISCSFIIKPLIGIRASKIREDIDTNLFTMITLSNNTTALGEKTFNDKQEYWGIGPILGIQGNWELGCGFSLYGTFVASLLYGKYNIHFNDQDIFTGAINKQIFNVAKRHLTAFDCNTNFALGINWNLQFCNNYDLKLRLSIEQHQYFNQNRICVGRGDISFTGGVFTMILGF